MTTKVKTELPDIDEDRSGADAVAVAAKNSDSSDNVGDADRQSDKNSSGDAAAINAAAAAAAEYVFKKEQILDLSRIADDDDADSADGIRYQYVVVIALQTFPGQSLSRTDVSRTSYTKEFSCT